MNLPSNNDENTVLQCCSAPRLAVIHCDAGVVAFLQHSRLQFTNGVFSNKLICWNHWLRIYKPFAISKMTNLTNLKKKMSCTPNSVAFWNLWILKIHKIWILSLWCKQWLYEFIKLQSGLVRLLTFWQSSEKNENSINGDEGNPTNILLCICETSFWGMPKQQQFELIL